MLSKKKERDSHIPIPWSEKARKYGKSINVIADKRDFFSSFKIILDTKKIIIEDKELKIIATIFPVIKDTPKILKNNAIV